MPTDEARVASVASERASSDECDDRRARGAEYAIEDLRLPAAKEGAERVRLLNGDDGSNAEGE